MKPSFAMKVPFTILLSSCTSLVFAQSPGVRFTIDALDGLTEKSSVVVTARIEGKSFIRQGSTEPEKRKTEPAEPKTEAPKSTVKTEPPKTAAYTGIGSDELSGQILDDRLVDEQAVDNLMQPREVVGTWYDLRVTQVLKHVGGVSALEKDMHVAMYVSGSLTTDSDQPCSLVTGEPYIFFLVPLDKDASISLSENERKKTPLGPTVFDGIGRQWSVMPLRKSYVSRVKSYMWKQRLQFWRWF